MKKNMSTKFVSKNSNYMVVLKPGIPGSRSLGTPTTPGLYVKFQDGVVIVKEESIAEQLRNHPSFDTDFMEVKEQEIDPYQNTRKNSEPNHILTQIEHGKAGKTVKQPKEITPEMRNLIQKEAIKMIPVILQNNPDLLKGVLGNKETQESQDTATVEADSSEPETVEPETVDKSEGTKEETTNIGGVDLTGVKPEETEEKEEEKPKTVKPKTKVNKPKTNKTASSSKGTSK